MAVTNDHGVTFTVRCVRPGDRWGRNGCLVFPSSEFERKRAEEGDFLVEFYDGGTFVQRYFASTFLDGSTETAVRGLALYASVPRWSLSPRNVASVQDAIKGGAL